MEKRLHRDEHRKVIGGVCAGLAEHFGTDVAVIRAIFLVTLILKGFSLPIYIILWIVLPKKGFNFTPGVDYRVPPQNDPFNPFSGAPQSGSFDPKFGNQPFNPPFVHPPKKQASTVGLIIGVIMIILGSVFLLNELDLMPDWDFDNIWPVMLVGAGIALIVSGIKKQPWEKQNWHANEVTDAPEAEPNKEETETKDTPPTI
jgi:phage shock protein C